MWQGRLERVLLKHLATVKVDFACMQEAVAIDGWTMGLATTYQKIGAALRLDQHQFFSPMIATKLGDKDLAFGNVTYSRVPFSETKTIFTGGKFNGGFAIDDDYNVRAFQHSLVEIDGKKLHLINHHGHHIDAHKLGDEETMRQVQQIVDYIQTLDGGVIVCGDFNLSPNSESIQYLDGILRNLSTEYDLRTTRSLLTHKDEVCDYIFVNDHIDVRDFLMDETIVSDHNALFLDFELK